MSRFKKGERVRVVIEGEVNTYSKGGGLYEAIYVTTGNGYECHYVLLGIAGSPKGTVSVERLDPAGWPPQVGDIWEADGREYCVQKWPLGAKVRVSSFDAPDTYWYAIELEGFKALNPVLVRRRGQ